MELELHGRIYNGNGGGGPICYNNDCSPLLIDRIGLFLLSMEDRAVLSDTGHCCLCHIGTGWCLNLVNDQVSKT